jgi:hypothetical protein
VLGSGSVATRMGPGLLMRQAHNSRPTLNPVVGESEYIFLGGRTGLCSSTVHCLLMSENQLRALTCLLDSSGR